ncbi:MAG: branched-chain amino acid transport system permease protein [Pseudonocardiales bacterium]|nr:branched-chain amino acid transport system permease protein [Pseudonocardiales bacterium]
MTTTTNAPAGGRTGVRGPWRDRWNSLSRPQQWAVLIPVVVLIYLLPVLNPPLLTTEPGTNFPIAMFNAARFALVAVGLNVVVGQAGLLDLGYVGFFAIGAYVAAIFTSPDSMAAKLPYLACLPLAMVVTMVFGLILGAPTLRLRGDYLAIVTLGFGEIVRLLATIVTPLKGQVGFQQVGSPPGIGSDGQPIFSNSNGTAWYWLVVTLTIVVLLLVGNLERSRVGRAWVAIREDEDVAQIMGVPTIRFKLWAFVIGAAIGGLSGALFAGQVGFVNNQKFDVPTSVLFLAAVVLGGSGNKVGVLLGAFLVSYIPDRFTALADYKYLIFGVALIVLMIFRPQGLLGARQRLLANGRTAYQRLVGRPEQLSKDSSLTAEGRTP